MSYKLNPFTGKLDLTGGDIQTSGDFELNTVPSTYSTFKYDRGSQSSAGKYTISGSGSTAKFLINKTDANGNAADTPVSGGEFWMSADGVTFVRGVLGTGSVLDFGSYWLLPSLVDHGVYEGLNIPDANGSDFYWSLGDPTGTPVALADGDVVQYNATEGKFKPAQISGGTALPTANDGQTLIQENGQWIAGPVIGGVDYTTVITGAPTYTVPTGYTFWSETWQVFPSGSTDITLSNGDLTASATTGGANVAASSTAKSSGKWYWELEINSSTADTFIGIKTTTDGSFPGQSGSGGIGIRKSGSIFNDSVANTNSASVISYADSDIVMFALDMDNGEVYMGKNGSWAGISDPSTGTSPFANTLTAGSYYFIGRGAVVGEEFTINKVSSSVQTTIPYSIDNLDDVDTSTVAPTDGTTLVYQNGTYIPGPVIGGSSSSNSDPDFSSVSLLLLGNGTNGSTTFTDSSSNALTVTGTGTAEISTAQSKFGGASIYLPAGADKISVAQNALFDFGSSAWTMEMWVYWTGGSGEATLVANRGSWSADALFWTIQSGGVMRIVKGGTGYTATNSISQNTWTHVALTYDGTDLRFSIDGVIDATHTISGSWNWSDGGTDFGAMTQFTNTFTGYMDDIRITKGVARYTANFTAPTAQLPTQGAVTVADSIRTLLGIDEYSSDSAAGTGGVASGALYYNTTSSDYRLKS